MMKALPIEVIKRIEIIKGHKSCLWSKCFTGAVNIVTKDSLDNDASLRLQAGSYGQFSAAVTAGVSLTESNHILFFSKNISNGYPTNTDLTIKILLKSVF
jgi:iron complex outermembrane receptor protein